jgi:hypothetical protein
MSFTPRLCQYATCFGSAKPSSGACINVKTHILNQITQNSVKIVQKPQWTSEVPLRLLHFVRLWLLAHVQMFIHAYTHVHTHVYTHAQRTGAGLDPVPVWAMPRQKKNLFPIDRVSTQYARHSTECGLPAALNSAQRNGFWWLFHLILGELPL